MTAPLAPGDERVEEVRRVMTAKEAGAMVGTAVGTDLVPTFASPPVGSHVRVVDKETGEPVAFVTRLPRDRAAELRAALRASDRLLGDQARHAKGMLGKAVTFGYLPRKPMAKREACTASSFIRDAPKIEDALERLALDLSEQFDALFPARAAADARTIDDSVLADWRLAEKSLWTSGVINKTSTLPYHRDGNNFETWSAMPSIRYGMAGGHLHLPEYDLTFPIGDGDVTWFYGRGLVHGVTPMRPRPGKRDDAYRYSCVFYAVRGLKDCRTYAEETRLQAIRRTERERATAAALRERLALNPEGGAQP